MTTTRAWRDGNDPEVVRAFRTAIVNLLTPGASWIASARGVRFEESRSQIKVELRARKWGWSRRYVEDVLDDMARSGEIVKREVWTNGNLRQVWYSLPLTEEGR